MANSKLVWKHKKKPGQKCKGHFKYSGKTRSFFLIEGKTKLKFTSPEHAKAEGWKVS